jgi:hypothetical protein
MCEKLISIIYNLCLIFYEYKKYLKGDKYK